VAFFAGDVDMVDAMKAYSKIGFTGAMQPDHTPLMTLPEGSERATWHVGTAFAVGYMKAAARAAGVPFETIQEARHAEQQEQEQEQQESRPMPHDRKPSGSRNITSSRQTVTTR